jgi:transposase
MQNHLIIEMLGVKDNKVKVRDISQGPDALIVEHYTEKRQQKCSFCRCKIKRVHSYRIQPIQRPVLPN